MKKTLCVLLTIVLVVLSSSCGFVNNFKKQTQDNSEDLFDFYDIVCEAKELLDKVATDVCTVWKDSEPTSSTKDVNDELQKALQDHQTTVDEINSLNNEIDALFSIVKSGRESDWVKEVMSAYKKYHDSILNANAALTMSGYIEISLNREYLEYSLRELYAEM